MNLRRLVVHEQRKDNDDRQWHAKKPEQCAASKSHDRLLFDVPPSTRRNGTRSLQDHEQDDQADRSAE